MTDMKPPNLKVIAIDSCNVCEYLGYDSKNIFFCTKYPSYRLHHRLIAERICDDFEKE